MGEGEEKEGKRRCIWKRRALTHGRCSLALAFTSGIRSPDPLLSTDAPLPHPCRYRTPSPHTHSLCSSLLVFPRFTPNGTHVRLPACCYLSDVGVIGRVD